MTCRVTIKAQKKKGKNMRKLIVGLSLVLALVAGGTYLSACKASATPAGGDSTAVVDTLKKDSTVVDSAKVDTAKADSVKGK